MRFKPRVSRFVLLPALSAAVILFNLFFAIRPHTAEPPPLKFIPEDIFQHRDWASANYVGQGQYISSLATNVRLIAFSGQAVPGDVLFSRVSNISLSIERATPPSVSKAELENWETNGLSLLTDGSDTECAMVGVEAGSPPDRCAIEIFVEESPGQIPQELLLVQIQSSTDRMVFVDFRLLAGSTWPDSENTSQYE